MSRVMTKEHKRVDSGGKRRGRGGGLAPRGVRQANEKNGRGGGAAKGRLGPGLGIIKEHDPIPEDGGPWPVGEG